MISSKHLADAIYKLSLDKSLNKKDLVDKVFEYVKAYKLEAILPKAIMHLEEKLRKDKEWNTFAVSSGRVIDESLVHDIRKKLDAGEASEIKKEVDEDLIGGFVATYKGVIYDASLKNQLRLLRQVLTK